MMKNDSPMPDVPQDGVDSAAREKADWPLDQIKELALKLYVRFPFDEEDHPDGWKDLVREAFTVFDNLDEACKEILKERSKDRRATARQREAYKKLTSVTPFERAVRYITGEKRRNAQESKFEKVLSYEARIVPWEGRVCSNLPAKEKRRIEGAAQKVAAERHALSRSGPIAITIRTQLAECLGGTEQRKACETHGQEARREKLLWLKPVARPTC